MRSIVHACIFGTMAVASFASVTPAHAGDGQPVAVAASATSDFAMDFDDMAMDDHDVPVIHFGRAVDLAGADIEPVGHVKIQVSVGSGVFGIGRNVDVDPQQIVLHRRADRLGGNPESAIEFAQLPDLRLGLGILVPESEAVIYAPVIV